MMHRSSNRTSKQGHLSNVDGCQQHTRRELTLPSHAELIGPHQQIVQTKGASDTEPSASYSAYCAVVLYNFRRGHSGRDQLPPVRDAETPVAVDFSKERIVCREELGGQLKSYHRAA